MFQKDQRYKRRWLHETYGGQQRGGISTPAKKAVIFLFTGEPGEPYGYTDWESPDGSYHYFGEGQRGDMQFRGGNKAIRDHAANGEELHLFKMMRHDPEVCYLGQFVCGGCEIRSAPDVDRRTRKAIVFRLDPV